MFLEVSLRCSWSSSPRTEGYSLSLVREREPLNKEVHQHSVHRLVLYESKRKQKACLTPAQPRVKSVNQGTLFFSPSSSQQPARHQDVPLV